MTCDFQSLLLFHTSLFCVGSVGLTLLFLRQRSKLPRICANLQFRPKDVQTATPLSYEVYFGAQKEGRRLFFAAFSYPELFFFSSLHFIFCLYFTQNKIPSKVPYVFLFFFVAFSESFVSRLLVLNSRRPKMLASSVAGDPKYAFRPHSRRNKICASSSSFEASPCVTPWRMWSVSFWKLKPAS